MAVIVPCARAFSALLMPPLPLSRLPTGAARIRLATCAVLDASGTSGRTTTSDGPACAITWAGSLAAAGSILADAGTVAAYRWSYAVLNAAGGWRRGAAGTPSGCRTAFVLRWA